MFDIEQVFARAEVSNICRNLHQKGRHRAANIVWWANRLAPNMLGLAATLPAVYLLS